MVLDQTSIDTYRRDGVVVLRGVVPAETLALLSHGVAENLAHPSPWANDYTPSHENGRFFDDYVSWQRISAFRQAALEGVLPAVAGALMGTRRPRFFHEHVLVKEPGADVPTPWHQDQPYYCVDGTDTVSLWIPLDSVPRERTLEFVAGSHKWGKYFRPERFNKTALNENDGLEPVPDIDGNRDQYQVLGWALEPGDAVAFNYLTLHGAPANKSKVEQRRAFSLRLMGDNVRFARREGINTSPPFRGVTLQHGAVMDAPEFPLLAG